MSTHLDKSKGRISRRVRAASRRRRPLKQPRIRSFSIPPEIIALVDELVERDKLNENESDAYSVIDLAVLDAVERGSEAVFMLALDRYYAGLERGAQ